MFREQKQDTAREAIALTADSADRGGELTAVDRTLRQGTMPAAFLQTLQYDRFKKEGRVPHAFALGGCHHRARHDSLARYRTRWYRGTRHELPGGSK